MEVLVSIGVVVVVLFIVAFMTGRRFGLLGLALAAGYVLSVIWADELPRLVEQVPYEVPYVSSVTLATLLIILMPSMILLFGGSAYRSLRGRAAGALFYAVLAVIFSLGSLEYTVALMGSSRIIYETLIQYQQYILTAALAGAVIDIMHARSQSSGDKHDKKH